MQAHLQEPPRLPLELNPTLPAGVSEIIMIAMAKKPGERFQSADAFRNALQSVANSLGVATLSTAQVAALIPTPTPAAGRSGGTAPMTSPRAPQTPAPSPAAAPSQATPMPPPRSSGGSHRGLYVGLGAFLVLVVLGAAAFSLPRFLGTRAGSANHPPANASSVPATPAQDAQTAAPAPPAANDAGAAPPVGDQPATVTPAAPAPNDVSVPAATPPADTGPSIEQQLEELDHNLDQLSSRQISVNSSLDALQRQQAAQGLGLRGDIVSAQARVQANMAKAQAAIQAKDPKTAKKYLDLAEPDIEKLEKFLGR